METLNWVDEKEKIKEEALKEHTRLHKLFIDDRLSFERERKRMIREVIESAETEEKRQRLMELQEQWDKRMRGAGSKHNRLVLAQTFFWDHFHENFKPAIETFNAALGNEVE